MSPKNFFKISVNKIHQAENGGGLMLIGKLKFEQLDLIHKLRERQESDLDPLGENNKENKFLDEEAFNRWITKDKLKNMIKFLKGEESEVKENLILFPTSMILAMDLHRGYDIKELTENFMDEIYENDKNNNKKLKECFINEDNTELFIPKNNEIALIVDGQHRFMSMKNFLEDSTTKDKINNFELPITFLLGFDIYEVATIFAKVNFTQKPVNRSIYYDIFGSIPGELSDIRLAHVLALHLNNNEDSPIKGMIKLLGRGPGLFSQAFFVKKMLTHFKGVWREIYSDYLEGGEKYEKELPKFMKVYIKSIRESYPDCWPREIENEKGELEYQPNNKDCLYKYILCKPTGIGAFFRLIKDFYPLVKNLSEQEMEKKIKKFLKKISFDKSKELFSTEGPYGKTSSEGFVAKLYTCLQEKYGFR